jgi:hypothetical protein
MRTSSAKRTGSAIRRGLLAALLAVPVVAGPAVAGVIDTRPFEGNDTGGIIAWSPAIAYTYRDIAAAHCAQWNKAAQITSVHRRYGDYVAFRCHFPRGYDPRKWMLYGGPVRSAY